MAAGTAPAANCPPERAGMEEGSCPTPYGMSFRGRNAVSPFGPGRTALCRRFAIAVFKGKTLQGNSPLKMGIALVVARATTCNRTYGKTTLFP